MIRPALAVLALAFGLAHLPFLPSTLEDIDSVNFALGVRDYDVAEHRPHPPGYPVYIALGKLGAAAARPLMPGPSSAVEARTLSVLSLLGALAAVYMLYRGLTAMTVAPGESDFMTPPWRALDTRALAAAALTACCPLFWYLAVRPMSDVPGLAAAWAALACLALAWWRQQPVAGDRRLSVARLAGSGRMIVLGALVSGVAIGFRAQNAVLTLPFLVGVLLDRIGRGSGAAIVGATVALGGGVLVWAVPLVVVSGGVSGYLAALGAQAGEDFAGVEMLYLNPEPRALALAVLRTLVYPWDSVVLGTVVAALAAVGGVALLVREQRTLAALVLVGAPYLGFHLLFHDTGFVRYALPLVPIVAFLAVAGLEVAARAAAYPAAGALALWGVSLAVPVLAAYAREPSPTSRAVSAMRDASREALPGALAMHQTFRRPLEAEDVSFVPQLPAPPRREWLELAKYWRDGNTAPVWFLADPRRTDLALVDPRSRESRLDFLWSWTSLNDLGGMRPPGVQWYRLAVPGWFAEEGWALTPETAGIARLMGRGPSDGPITAFVRRRPEAARVMIGGRHLGGARDAPVTFVVELETREVMRWEAGPGFFLHDFDLPAGALGGEGLVPLSIRAISGQGGSVATAIEQFDLQSTGVLMWGYDEGWHEAEYQPSVGVWRWTSGRATLRVIGASTAVTLTISVESPRHDFDELPTVRLTAGADLLGETRFADSTVWQVDVPLDALLRSQGRLTIETDRTFVPADRSGVPDERALGLRVFRVDVSPQH